jgi:hypothetical protein
MVLFLTFYPEMETGCKGEARLDGKLDEFPGYQY